jgi:hypothetical protein
MPSRKGGKMFSEVGAHGDRKRLRRHRRESRLEILSLGRFELLARRELLAADLAWVQQSGADPLATPSSEYATVIASNGSLYVAGNTSGSSRQHKRNFPRTANDQRF